MTLLNAKTFTFPFINKTDTWLHALHCHKSRIHFDKTSIRYMVIMRSQTPFALPMIHSHLDRRNNLVTQNIICINYQYLTLKKIIDVMFRSMPSSRFNLKRRLQCQWTSQLNRHTTNVQGNLYQLFSLLSSTSSFVVPTMFLLTLFQKENRLKYQKAY